jgi:hypothetical protein
MFATNNTNGFRMTFANGWAVSVQWHAGCYASERGQRETKTAEVAVIRPDGEFDGDVHGWMTTDTVAKLMAKVAHKKG